MMKVFFAHDHKLREKENKYFTVGGLRDSLTERYTQFCDELVICCRAVPEQKFDTKLFEIKNNKVRVLAISSGSLILSSKALRIMEEEIKSSDAVIARLHSKIAEYAIHFARKYRIPYLVEMVGCPWDAYWNHSLFGKFVAPYMTYTTKREVLRAPYVVYVTKYFLENRYPTRGKWIACSDVELDSIDSDILVKRLEKIKKSDKNRLKIGTLAQVDVRYKGQEYVIKALSELNKRGKHYIYYLAGSGNTKYLQDIAKKYGVSQQVKFCGVIPHNHIFEWLDSIDFYIQPSKQEGLPRSLIEALSRACPAAGTKVGGIPELLDASYLFKKGNVSEIVSILDKLNKDYLGKSAETSFTKANEYQSNSIDDKRYKFYKSFFDLIKR